MSPADLAYLQTMARDVVAAATIAPGQTIRGSWRGQDRLYGPNRLGHDIVRPGGGQSYPAFWVRDLVMSLGCGCIPAAAQEHALALIAAAQQEGDLALPSGSRIPHGSIPDHINLTGEPIYFPGTYDPLAQGGIWGGLPPACDHFYFILLAQAVVERGGAQVLQQNIAGRPLWQRLNLAFHAVPACPQTHLVQYDGDNPGVGFGFCDAILHGGHVLFASLLKWQAARALARLAQRLHQLDTAARMQAIADAIRQAIPHVFAGEQPGTLLAATRWSTQPDVWAMAYASYLGALDAALDNQVCRQLLQWHIDGQITWRGAVRHVPMSCDASVESCWSCCRTPLRKNRYQNGAYWPTPVGWLAWALAKIDLAVATALLSDYVQELRSDDFRQGHRHGAPWECMHEQDHHRQNPVYMTSVTVPLEVCLRAGPRQVSASPTP